MKKNNTPSQNQESVFVKSLSKYVTYWPLFVFFLIVGLATAFAYMYYSTPEYEATASLIIKDEKKGNDDSKIMESFNIINNKKIIENEIDIIQSRPIIDKVVSNLHLYAPFYFSNQLNASSIYLDGPIIIECDRPDSLLIPSEKIPITYNASTELVFVNNASYYPINKRVKTPFGEFTFVPNEKYIKQSSQTEFFFSLYKLDDIVKKVQDNLKVTATNKLSSIVNLKYKDESPKLAKDVLNEIITSYNDMSTNDKKSYAKNTLNFVVERLNIVSGELNTIENRIQQYKDKSGAIDISTQGQLFLQNVSLNDQKLSDVNNQLTVINQLEKLVSENANNIGMLSSTIGVNDPTLLHLFNNLNTSELELERLKKTVAINNPILVSISDQIAKTKTNIIDHIQSQRNSLETSKLNIVSTNETYNDMLHSMPLKERELLEISRDKNIKSAIYSFLLQKREESELSLASTISDNKVINYAQSASLPVSPNKYIVFGLTLFLILGLPITFINTRELLNNKILYRQEIESLTSIPIIGEVAYNKSGKQLVVETGVRSFIGEEFRKIRNSLRFMGIDGTHKKILVTSGISGEGKSFIASNLAISFSLSGNKVVLLDLDLHNSFLGKTFEKELLPGSSDYLAGLVDIKDIIYSVPAYDNLYFIPSGTLTEKPSELIENGKIEGLLKYLEEKFDITIIDSEPVELVTDARIITSLCDTTLYVVRHLISPKMLLKIFDQNNAMSPLKNPGIIFNGVKTRGYIKDNYGYGYGYVYGEKELSKREKKQMKSKLASA